MRFGRLCPFVSKHDPQATLNQINDSALRAQELCAENDLPAILADWHKRLAFERVMELLGEAGKRLPPNLCSDTRQCRGS